MPNVVVVLVENSAQYFTATVPYSVPAPDGTMTITWTAAGPDARFPLTNYFTWKTSPPPLSGTLPTRVDATTLELTYNNEFVGKWEYAVTIENEETIITIDPEIDNGPPR